MKVFLSNHFRKRYGERIGYLSEQTMKEKIREKVQEFDSSIIVAKFRMGNMVIVARRVRGNWLAITVGKANGVRETNGTGD